MALYTAGTAFLQVAPSMRGFHNEVRNQLRTMKLEATVQLKPEVSKTQFEAAARAAKPSDQKVEIKADIDRKSFTDAANSVSLLARNIATLGVKPAAVIAATPLILNLAAAAAQASTSLLLLPAAGAAVGIVMGTMKVATAGFSDALKTAMDPNASPEKLAKQLAALPPPVRETVLSIKALNPEIDKLRATVAGQFFAGFSREISELGKVYFPVLRAGMAPIAGDLNAAAVGASQFVRQAQTVRDVQTIFQNTHESTAELSPVLEDILLILRDVAVVGSEFLPGLSSGFREAADSAALFVNNARESGKLHDWIVSGLDTLGEWGKTVSNLGQLIFVVFSKADISGRSFSHTMTEVTGQWLAWAKSAQGSEIITQVFQTIFDLAKALAPLFGAIAGAIIAMLLQVGPALPPLIKGITDVFAASGPLLSVFSQLAIAVLPMVGAGLSAMSGFLGPMLAIITNAVVAFKIYEATVKTIELATKAWAIAQALLNGTLAINPIGLVVVAVLALAAALVYAWNNSETFRNIVTAAWDGIKAAASGAWEFLKGVWAWLSTQVTAAGDWFVRMGESIKGAWNDVTGAVSTAWGWLVANVWDPMVNFVTVTVPGAWDGLVAKVKAVWDGIVTAIKFAVTLILTIILAPLLLFIEEVFPGGLKGLLATWTAIWEGMKATLQRWWDFAVGIWNLVVNFITVTLPNAFGTFFTNVTNGWNQLLAVLRGWWDWVLNNIWQPIVNFIDQWLVPKFNFFRDQWTAASNQLLDVLRGWWNWVLNNIWQPIVDFINVHLVPRFQWLRDRAIEAWNAMRDGINAGWQWILNNIWNPLVNFITKTIPDAFNTGVSAVERVWNAIKRALRDPLQAAIDVVWNHGLVPTWNTIADFVQLDPKYRLHEVYLQAFAAGGPIHGGIPGVDSVLMLGQQGEYVLSVPAVNALGGVGAVDAMHSALVGGTVGGDGASAPVPGYASGGPIGGTQTSGSASITSTTGSAQATTVFGDIWNKITGAITDVINRVGSSPWGQLLVGWGKKIVGAAVDWLKGKLASFVSVVTGGGGGAPPPGSGAVVAQVQQAAAALGWGSGPQWDALSWIISHESGWNPNAQNPTSTAYGLFQFLNSTWAGVGGSKTSNPYQQAVYGMRYIQSRYGSPLGAKAFWQSHGWYDSGGLGAGRGIMLKDVIEPERVLSPRQTQAFEDLVGHLTGGRSRVLRSDGVDTPTGRAAVGSQPFIGQVVVPVPEGANVDQTIDAIMTRARHEAKRTGRYSRP